MIDFRSDTVTQPTDAMRDAMRNAAVGDDVFQEDPTVNELERYAAQLFGKEAGLFCTSGTQTNQIAIQVHCKPGDDVICSEKAHIYYYEGGGIARNAGASVTLLSGDCGRIYPQDIPLHIYDPEDPHHPLTALVAIEDTMNRGGGAIYDFNQIKAIRKICQQHQLPLHLDGARVFNALTETQINSAIYGAQFDSISICLSKGLGAPIGSVLLGSNDFIRKARRIRKVMGGGMRQAGIIAAGGLFALNNHLDRLKTDHKNAKLLANGLQLIDWIESVWPTQTNIIVAELKSDCNVNHIISKAKEKGVLFLGFGEQKIRLVTHLNISTDQVNDTLELLATIKT